ncbi:MAG: CHASE2 domain-containing protein, partial [Candidatus Dactylopiibacterium sp.]|nr:CHASE2 domain-containing protein [Candidatus Dactylopiibacterium sp.]
MPMRPDRRILLEWGLVSLIVCALVTLSSLQGWLWRADLQLYDIALSRQEVAADPAVVIVAIDNDSLDALGRWPWPRHLHASLIERLRAAGAGPIGLDLVFAESGPDDAALADAMRRHGRVVLPMLQQVRHGRITGESTPTPRLRAAAARLGHIQAEFDPDGIVRSTYRYEGWETAATAQFALALLDLERGTPPRPPGAQGGPGWQRAGWMRVPFAGPAGSFTQYAYADVLNGRVPDAALRGKTILVGVTSAGMADAVPVPESGQLGLMPGVEFHANVLSSLRKDSAIQLLPRWLGALLTAAICLLQMLLLARMNARTGLVWTAVVLLGILLLSVLALAIPALWIRPASAILGCLTAYPLWSWRRLEAMQRYVEAEMKALRAVHLVPAGGHLDPVQQQLGALRAAAGLAREAHRLVETVIAHLPVGVVALYADGRVRVDNRAARELLGADTPEAVGAALRAL